MVNQMSTTESTFITIVNGFDGKIYEMGILEFTSWLRQEMQERGMSQADLARKSGLTTAAISNLVNGNRNLGEEAGRAIARAFDIPAETIFRMAGLLPPQTDEADPLVSEGMVLLSQLPDDQRRWAVSMLRALVADEKRMRRNAK